VGFEGWNRLARLREHIARIGLWALVAVLAIRGVPFLADAAVRPSHGFVAYYTASRLVAEGADSARFYDDIWFKAQMKRYGLAADDVHINPPATNLLLLPLVGLDYTSARVIWTIFNLVILAGSVTWILWQTGLRGLWIPACIAFVLMFEPLYANFYLGQAYVLVLGLLMAAWHAVRHQRDRSVGVSLGLALILKLAGVFVWLLLLIRRCWTALAWAAGSALAIVVVSLPWLGLNAWFAYAQVVAGLSAQPERAVTAYQTTLGFFRHLFTFDEKWNLAPLVHSPLLGTLLPWLAFAALAGVSAYRVHRTRQTDLAFSGFVILGVILSPLSLDYHYVVLLLPAAILATWARERRRPWVWCVLVVALAFVAADLPYRSPALTEGARSLLAYPKLYGALMLWGLSMWGCDH
jgi:hypothetical protein